MDLEDLKNVIEGGLLEGYEDACAVLGGIWNAVLDLNAAFPLIVLNTAVTEDMSMLCNTIVVSFYNVSVFRVNFLFADVELSQGLWQALTAHQSIKEYEFKDYTFASATDANDMTIIGGMTEFLEYIFTLNIEENGKISNEGMNKNRTQYTNMTVYVRTINGKTISIKCDRQQKAARLLEIAERKTSIPRGMMYLVNQGKVLNDRKIKENNNEAGTTIEMSLRIMGGMKKEEQMETSETEEDTEKRKLKEMIGSKPSRLSDDAECLKTEIINEIKRSDEKMEHLSKRTEDRMEIYSNRTDEKNGKYHACHHERTQSAFKYRERTQPWKNEKKMMTGTNKSMKESPTWRKSS